MIAFTAAFGKPPAIGRFVYWAVNTQVLLYLVKETYNTVHREEIQYFRHARSRRSRFALVGQQRHIAQVIHADPTLRRQKQLSSYRTA